MKLTAHRLDPIAIDNGMRHALCDIWVNDLVENCGISTATAMERIYGPAAKTTVEALRHQAEQARGGLYVVRLGRTGLAAAARVSLADPLGVGTELPGGDRVRALYVNNLGVQGGSGAFRAIINEARQDLNQPGDRLTHARVYRHVAPEDDDNIPALVAAINPPTYATSDRTVSGKVGGVMGEYRLHSVQFPDEKPSLPSAQRASDLGRTVLRTVRSWLPDPSGLDLSGRRQPAVAFRPETVH